MTYRRIFQLAKPYYGALTRTVGLYLVFTVLSLVGIGMVIPVLDIILGGTESQIMARPVALNDVDSLQAWLAYWVTQGVTAYGAMGMLWRVCVATLSLFILKNLTRYAALWNMATVRSGISAEFRRGVHDALLRLSPVQLGQKRRGDIMSRASADVTEVEWAVLTGLELIVREPLIILGTLAILLAMSMKFTLFILLVAPIAAWLLNRVSKRLKRKSSLAQDALGHTLSVLEATLSGLRTLQVFQAEGRRAEQFAGVNRDAMRAAQSVQRRRDLASPISEIIGVTTLLVILWFGGQVVLIDGALTGAALVGYVLFFYQLIPSFRAISMALYNIQKGGAAADRLFEVMDSQSDIQDPSQVAQTAMTAAGPSTIAWDNVSVRYPGREDWALQDFSAEIQRGQTVALVGPSGGGKSTLANLLVRALDPSRGQVTLDGIPAWSDDAAAWSLKDLRSQFAVVSQDPVIFNDSALANIALGDAAPDRARAKAAADAARATEFIESIGWETPLGDGGGQLSGGQRQRLALARALYRNAPVLILDEATSALDAENEKLIQEAMDSAMRDRTTVVIAHRLATIQHADRILVVDGGRLVASGTHQELMDQGGLYAQLVQTQTFST